VTSRDAILSAVRANVPPSRPMPQVPTFPKIAHSLVDDFAAALTRMGGKLAKAQTSADLQQVVGSLFPHANVICSAAAELKGTRELDPGSHPAALANVDAAVVRAAFGVAETGSIWLSEEELAVNALAYLAQHLIALLDPAEIVGNLHQAYRDPRFKTARYAVLVTGPSATADIEGVLIHGAQGVRSLTVVLMPCMGRLSVVTHGASMHAPQSSV
jgi:L-lactate dehydrogenase complex protein LldG